MEQREIKVYAVLYAKGSGLIEELVFRLVCRNKSDSSDKMNCVHRKHKTDHLDRALRIRAFM